MIADSGELDGMATFTMESMEFPDWTLESAGISILPLETTVYGWDQLRQPYPSYPNIDLGLPPPMPSEEPWRYPRWPQGQENNDSGNESGEDEEDDVVNQVSARMGSLHLSEDGELRYYGATSNLTLLDDDTSPLDHRRDLEADNMRKRGLAMIEAAGLNQTVDPDLVRHLTTLYFAWQDPSFHVVDKDMYEREQARYNRSNDDSTFYSETLMNIM